MVEESGMTPARVRFGSLWVDALRLGEALAAIERLVDRRQGGAVFTPNIDHVVLASHSPAFRAAYARADLSLCDGQPIKWGSRLLGLPLPEKVSGADLFLPLMQLAARRGWRVFLFGGSPGVGEEAAARLGSELGVQVVGVSAPRVGLEPTPDEAAEIERVAAARPDLVITSLGAPKGELWIDRARERLGPAVSVQLGASIDFYLGRARRAPGWMQRAGLEWLFRLLQEPRRLAYRYLVQDPAFVAIFLRTLLSPRQSRLAPASAIVPPRTRRLRVLILAESANPQLSSASLIGWSLSQALARVAEVHLVTDARNREGIEQAGWKEGREFTAIDPGALSRPFNRFTAVVQKITGLGWTFATAVSIIPYFYWEWLVWRRFGEAIRSGSYDLVHRITPVSPAMPSPIARRCQKAGVPFVWGSLNGGVPWPKEFQDRLRSEGEWLSYVRGLHKLVPAFRSTRRSAAVILAGSRVVWEEMAPWQDRCVYLPENAVDPDRFAVERPARAAGPLRVAFVGRLVPLKGVDMLLEAAEPLLRSGRMKLDLVGDGPERANLERQAAAAGVSGSVEFAGWVDHREVGPRLARADVFGFPSVREFGGGVVLEAMALGVPAAVVDYAGPAELVTETTGYRVPIGTRAAVVARYRELLEQLAADPLAARAVGEQARRRVYRLFTWEVKAAQVLEVYRWVLGERDRPDFGMPFPDDDAAGERAAGA
jgi:exopolysaccharide biosynthesis WecB/TagA/CpsF family protein